jgi:hypothetical protein
MTGDNPTRACNGSAPCTVSSCTYTAGGVAQNQFFVLSGVNYVIVDNFEWTGMCWSSTAQSYYNQIVSFNGASGPPNGIVIENNYCHGWTYTTSQQGNSACFAGSSSSGPGATLQFNVVDGSDSDDLAMSAFGQNATDTYIFQYNVVRHVGANIVSDDCHIAHDNLFEYTSMATDGSSHGDNYFCYAEVNLGSSAPNLFYNNVIRYVGTEYNQSVSYPLEDSPVSGQTDYIFNNVIHDSQPTGSPLFAIGDNNGKGNAVYWNNTASLGSAACIVCNGTPGTITSVNNHWIGATGISQAFQNTGTVTETSAVYMSAATATTQGYTTANDFAPTASGNSTVTASGTNETTGYCADSVLHNALAEAYCVEGTTKGCAYNSTNHTVSCPDVLAVARLSSGAWNVGAYQYSSSTPVSPPTSLTATPTPQ